METTPTTTEHAPIKTVLSDQLQEYGSLIHSLLTSVIRCSSSTAATVENNEALLSSSFQAPLSPQEITQAFLELDQKLKASVSTLIRQKRFQEQIEQLDGQIARVDQSLQSVIRRLHFAEQKLTEVVETARHRTEAARIARENPVDVESLLRLAGRLGPRTGAPPGWQAGDRAKQLHLHTPSYPTFSMISGSSLYLPLPAAFVSIDHPPPSASEPIPLLPSKDASVAGPIPSSPRSPSPHSHLESPSSSPRRGLSSSGQQSPLYSINFVVGEKKAIDFYMSDSDGSEDSEDSEDDDE